MSGRVTGYHYEIGPDGRRHRVYADAKAKAMVKSKAITGKGAYYKPRYARPVRGPGGYYDSGFVKTMRNVVPKGAFSSGGEMVGGPLGKFAGGMLSKILGFGAYSVKQNSLISEGQTPARMHTSSANTRVTHREYLADIVSSSVANTFTLQNFSINPGLFATFPWLSAIAQQYQEWVPHGVMFEFKTLSADAIASSTNTTLGGIIMATNYNSAAANFVNKQAMDNTEYTTSCKPSESFYHPVECARTQNVLAELYVRGGAVPSGQDQKTYDLGNFQIASFGIQGTSVVLGELWITYDIELRKPISTSAQGLDVLSDHFLLEPATTTKTTPLSSLPKLQPGSSIGGHCSTVTYFFNPLLQEGNYLVVWEALGTAATITAPILSYTNCSGVTIFNDSMVGAIAIPDNGVSSTRLVVMTCVSITGPGAAVVFGVAGTIPTAVTAADLIVTQINSAIQT